MRGILDLRVRSALAQAFRPSYVQKSFKFRIGSSLSALLNDVAYLTCIVIRIGLSLSALIIMTSNHNLMVYQK